MEQPSLDLDDLRAFFLIVETGSFARAAQRLATSKSILSRRVARLESLLSAQLLQRTARGTHVTEAGQQYYEEAKAAMAQLECASENLAESIKETSGALRVTAPVYFGSVYLTPALFEFMAIYPRVECEIILSDEKHDLVRDGFDLAVRLGHLPDSSLSMRTLCTSRRILVASPSYLDAHPPIETPQDLTAHRIIHYSGINTQDLWRYHCDGETHQLPIRPHMRSNSASVLMGAVVAGMGVTALPIFVAGPYIQAGRARQILSHCDWGITPVSLLVPQGRNTPRRVRLLIDFLLARFSNRDLDAL